MANSSPKRREINSIRSEAPLEELHYREICQSLSGSSHESCWESLKQIELRRLRRRRRDLFFALNLWLASKLETSRGHAHVLRPGPQAWIHPRALSYARCLAWPINASADDREIMEVIFHLFCVPAAESKQIKNTKRWNYKSKLCYIYLS